MNHFFQRNQTGISWQRKLANGLTTLRFLWIPGPLFLENSLILWGLKIGKSIPLVLDYHKNDYSSKLQKYTYWELVFFPGQPSNGNRNHIENLTLPRRSRPKRHIFTHLRSSHTRAHMKRLGLTQATKQGITARQTHAAIDAIQLNVCKTYSIHFIFHWSFANILINTLTCLIILYVNWQHHLAMFYAAVTTYFKKKLSQLVFETVPQITKPRNLAQLGAAQTQIII